MKNRRLFIASLALATLSTFNSQLSTVFAQGSLTPTGPPGPTMVTLQQIEPRTPIATTNLFTIRQPGSYYLTTNLTVGTGDAIDILINGVTLDLNGFTISSTSPNASGNAIYLAANGNTDIAIVNGHIVSGVTGNFVDGAWTFAGPGFINGITANGTPSNIRVSGVSVSGCLGDGINLGAGNSMVVESCTVSTVGGTGIVADRVSHSAAYYCAIDGIDANNASDCSGYGGYGDNAGDGLNVVFTANNCYGSSFSLAPINDAGAGLVATTANNCYGLSAGDGIGLSATTANNCFGEASLGGGGGTGIVAGSAINCYATEGDAAEAIGYAVIATIANSCTLGFGYVNIANKYNMP